MAEVAGLVLGINPLFISALERYEEVFQPLQHHKKYSLELQRYWLRLTTQKAIFRNNCQILLCSVTEIEEAKLMLRDVSHPLWMDVDLCDKIFHQFGESGISCKAVIRMMIMKLEEVIAECKIFDSVLSSFTLLDLSKDKTYLARLGEKLKSSLSESCLKMKLAELTELNNRFGILVTQASRLKNSGNPLLPIIDCQFQDRDMEHQTVREASAKVVESLDEACKDHQKHSAHFCLEPESGTKIDGNSLSIIFEMDFSQSKTAVSFEQRFIGIEVIPTLNGGNATLARKDHLTSHNGHQTIYRLDGTHYGEPSSDAVCAEALANHVRMKRRAYFSSFGSAFDRGLGSTTATESDIPKNQLPQCFCLCIQNCLQRKPQDNFIGFLTNKSSDNYMVYLSEIASSKRSIRPISLAQIIGDSSRILSNHKMLLYQKIRLARQLILAVLRYYATPLLKDKWRSDDIVFFQFDGPSRQSSDYLASPHLSVLLNNEPLGEVNKPSEDPLCRYLIKNSYLFQLGIVLLEIAYQGSLADFRKSEDLTNGQETSFTDFLTAQRLSQTVSEKLGLTYQRIVKKCLSCGFIDEINLNDIKLRQAIQRDAICELERLEKELSFERTT